LSSAKINQLQFHTTTANQPTMSLTTLAASATESESAPSLPTDVQTHTEHVPPHDEKQAIQPASQYVSLLRWLGEGMRAGFFLKPRLGDAQPTPWQVFVVFAFVSVVNLLLERGQVAGAAIFDVQAWLSGWWWLLAFIGLAWWAFPSPSMRSEVQGELHADVHADAQVDSQAEVPVKEAVIKSARLKGVATACVLWQLAILPADVAYQSLQLAYAQQWIKPVASLAIWAYWLAYGLFVAWLLAATLFVVASFIEKKWRIAVFALFIVVGIAISMTQFNNRSWQEDYSNKAPDTEEKPRLHLSQQTFEDQQALWSPKLAALASQRPDVADVYGLVFSPYASQDVFLRESTMVNKLLEERFDASGRTIHLLNHGGSTKTHLWATTPNLQRAVQALAKLMDKDKDILVVYLTSHGGSDFKLAAAHWPLEIEPLTPQELRSMLDETGIRHRVVAVSACYAGGWADVLANEHTLVMTAADATHTSYGCGARSDLTFFGRAVFDEQLRKTHSFEQAFNLAVPIIKQREIEGDKPDGFSNPQIRIGASIRPVLRELEQRLTTLVAKTP
jgi:Peptidase C13 family